MDNIGSMEDKYQKMIDEENERLNERIAKIERHHSRVRLNLLSAAAIIIGVTIYFCYILTRWV